jgi:3-dehydroquinate dehydratase
MYIQKNSYLVPFWSLQVKIKIMQTVECHGIDASEEAFWDDSNAICLNAPRASHGVAQVAIHSQVASQRTGVVEVHNADMAMY